jgi:hypothetical protein
MEGDLLIVCSRDHGLILMVCVSMGSKGSSLCVISMVVISVLCLLRLLTMICSLSLSTPEVH